MCRIYVNFHTTLRKVGSVLTGDYCSTYIRVLKTLSQSSSPVIKYRDEPFLAQKAQSGTLVRINFRQECGRLKNDIYYIIICVSAFFFVFLHPD